MYGAEKKNVKWERKNGKASGKGSKKLWLGRKTSPPERRIVYGYDNVDLPGKEGKRES